VRDEKLKEKESNEKENTERSYAWSKSEWLRLSEKRNA
jgi:hypothetical protein